MKLRDISAISFGVAMAASMSFAAADQVYKWVDSQGHVHFSQTPPPGTTVSAQTVTVNPAAPDPQSLANQQSLQQQLADKNKATADAAAKTKPDPAAAAQKKQHCDDLHTRLNILQQSGRTATTDAQGNITYLDDNARAQQIDAINQQIKSDCGG
jgi:hypothetical protein